MGLPVVKKCCGCVNLETGCLALCLTTAAACAAGAGWGCHQLPRHRQRPPEDNLIAMSVVMFCTLCCAGALLSLAGFWLKRPGFVQVSLLCNGISLACVWLVVVVGAVFGSWPALSPLPAAALAMLLLIIGAGYSVYYLIVINSLYLKMKSSYLETSVPV